MKSNQISNMRDVVYKGEYLGDFKSLKKLPPYGGKGKWVERGMAKVFVNDHGGEVIWWPDTGDVLSVHYAPPHEQLKCKAKKAGSRKRRRNWRTYASKILGEASLPELVFRNPVYFFRRLVFMLDAADRFDMGELKEIRKKISSIRIPPSSPPGSYVIHNFGPCDYIYKGFSIESKPVEHIRQPGFAVIDDKIDLLWCVTGCILESRSETPISSLLRIIDTGVPETWIGNDAKHSLTTMRIFYSSRHRGIGDPSMMPSMFSQKLAYQPQLTAI